MLLKLGQEATVGAYTVRNDGIKVTDDGQKQMITAYIAVLRGRQADRHDVSGAVVVPEARERGADDRGGDPPLARRRTCTSCCRRDTDFGTQTITPADRRQPAGGLDLVRLRRHGVRHRHRAAAGARATRSRWRSCRPTRPRRRGAARAGAAAWRRPTLSAQMHGARDPTASHVYAAQRRSSSRCGTRSSASAAAAPTNRLPQVHLRHVARDARRISRA